ncbi:N-acetylneuraminate synthase family protein [Thiohalorhabdus sp. Cl-TMA]|uniref:N-acetylneuraminate synthase family protein n=1 Tax=Thiohalorhabdus methylotrophus TaxID=3242694 RepID=A0ABV4TYZ3_9GAMM
MVQLGNRRIGDDQPTYITFEAGPTHDGLESAKKLAAHAVEAGADAIKFQVVDPDRLVADRSQPFTYEVLVNRETGETETVTEPLYDILQRRVLNTEEWHQLKGYCDEQGIAFFATATFEEEIDLLCDIECASLKIASGDVNHLPLIRRAARTGMCIQLDTGSSTLGEIETAVEAIRAEGNEQIIIHQCPSGYPARADSINLNIIPTLKQMFGYPAAFSDHTPGREMDIAAVAKGANLVEKTITLDRMTRSVEHVMSLEPNEMADFVESMRALETALGTSRRILHSKENESRLAVRRSVFLAEEGRAGQRLGDVAVEFRRPGHGLAPDRYEELVDATLGRDLPAGHRLSLADLA